MNEIIRVFERFLGRDLVYILAGAIPLICLGRILSPEIKCIGDVTSLKGVSWVWITLAVGVAYVLGYLMQEIFCLTPLSSTAIEGEPGCLVKWLFGRSQNKPWPEKGLPFDSPDGELLAQIRLQHSEKSAFGQHAERMTYLMQIGTALGPACIIGSALLLVWRFDFGTFDTKVGSGLLVVGLPFLILGALKRAQLREYVYRVVEYLKHNPEPPRSQE